MTTTLQVGLVPIARPTFDTAFAAEMLTHARQTLHQAADLSLVGPTDLVMDAAAAQSAIETLQKTPLDLLILLQASFADASVAVDLAAAVPQTPLLLWAVPDVPTGGRLRLNSLCGINLAGFSLRQAGRNFDYLHRAADDETVSETVINLAKAGRAARHLREARVGVIGQYPTGFDPCRYDATDLQERFGLRVTPLNLTDFFAQIKRQPDEQVESTLSVLSQRLPNLTELDQTAVKGTLRTFAALQELSQDERLDGIAVRCWPEFFTENGCAACSAMSMMSDNGVPCSCEADVNGTVTSLLLQSLSDAPVFLTDVVSADAEDDSFVFWHCGLAPLSMADPSAEARGTIHSNRNLPLLMEFPLKPGRITLARLSESGQHGYRLVIGRGEMLARPLSFSGTSGVCRFDSPVPQVLDVIMKEGLEHHLSITYGDHYDSLIAVADMLNLPVVPLTG